VDVSIKLKPRICLSDPQCTTLNLGIQNPLLFPHRRTGTKSRRLAWQSINRTNTEDVCLAITNVGLI
jgi:hypothetical protein